MRAGARDDRGIAARAGEAAHRQVQRVARALLEPVDAVLQGHSPRLGALDAALELARSRLDQV